MNQGRLLIIQDSDLGCTTFPNSRLPISIVVQIVDKVMMRHMYHVNVWTKLPPLWYTNQLEWQIRHDETLYIIIVV